MTASRALGDLRLLSPQLDHEILPDPPSFKKEEIGSAQASGDLTPILFEYYKYVGIVVSVIGHILLESSSYRSINKLHYAILTGLLNRCARLVFSNVATCHEGQFAEATVIVDRCIFESAIKISWFCKNPNDTKFVRFLAEGLRSDLELRDHIQKKIEERHGAIMTIEDRMLRSIRNSFVAAELTAQQIAETKRLPSLADMMIELGLSRLDYVVGQRLGSHHVHGTWVSLLTHYLDADVENGIHNFKPKVEPCEPHKNQFLHTSIVLLDCLGHYIEFAFADDDTAGRWVDFLAALRHDILDVNISSALADTEYLSDAKS